jgi:hypothetical protein
MNGNDIEISSMEIDWKDIIYLNSIGNIRKSQD